MILMYGYCNGNAHIDKTMKYLTNKISKSVVFNVECVRARFHVVRAFVSVMLMSILNNFARFFSSYCHSFRWKFLLWRALKTYKSVNVWCCAKASVLKMIQKHSFFIIIIISLGFVSCHFTIETACILLPMNVGI